MFCSFCKRVEFQFTNIKRRICLKGHVACEICDKNQRQCLACEETFSDYINVSLFWIIYLKSNPNNAILDRSW